MQKKVERLTVTSKDCTALMPTGAVEVKQRMEAVMEEIKGLNAEIIEAEAKHRLYTLLAQRTGFAPRGPPLLCLPEFLPPSRVASPTLSSQDRIPFPSIGEAISLRDGADRLQRMVPQFPNSLNVENMTGTTFAVTFRHDSLPSTSQVHCPSVSLSL